MSTYTNYIDCIIAFRCQHSDEIRKCKKGCHMHHIKASCLGSECDYIDKNGHASIRYFYKDNVFECRNDLIDYLTCNGIKITRSAIRAVVHGTGTMRVYEMYKDVFDYLTWEYKA